MKRQVKLVLILLSIVATCANAQSAEQDQSSDQETQVRGYWVDPTTGLMWTAKDNGKDVSRNQAASYCKNLKTASYSDWRLASIEELLAIHEKSAKSPGEFHLSHNHETKAATYDVKGRIFLTGRTWSGTDVIDDRSFRAEFAWFLDFNDDGRLYDKPSFDDGMRALCVRGSAHSQSTVEATASTWIAEETLARGYWVDSTTGLMWAAKDSFKDLRWHQAVKYCGDLRLAGHSDWRLATLSELEAIYDKGAQATGENPRSKWHQAESMGWHVKGNLFLSGDEWSSDRRLDDRGKPSGYDLYFNFNEGRADSDPSSFPYSFSGMRALCVRRP